MKAFSFLHPLSGCAIVGLPFVLAAAVAGQEGAGEIPSPVAPKLQAPAVPESEAEPRPEVEGITAMEALRRLTEKFGDKALTHIVEMRGTRGQSQPLMWKVAAVDLGSPFLLRTFRVDPSRETDEGENRAFYPDKPPAGFIAVSKLTVGSYDAFLVLDKVAAAAKVGFDSVDYRLRCRELSTEPVWTLTAIDVDGFAVGFLDISGVTGKTLRTIWLRRAGAQALPTIEDSALNKSLGE